MKHRITIFTILLYLSIFVLPVFSEPRLFGGLHGDFITPVHFNLNDYDSKALGYGFGGELEGGFYFGKFSVGLIGGFAFNTESELIQKNNDLFFGFEAGFDFDKEIIPLLPNWLAIRPNAAIFGNSYKAEGFRSHSKKNLGQKEESSGLSLLAEGEIALDFVNLLKYKSFDFIPVIAYKEVFRPEQDGHMFNGKISVGIRVISPPIKRKVPVVNTESGGTLSVYAKATPDLFSPNGDDVDDLVIFDVESDADEHKGLAFWELRIYDPGRKIFYTERGKGELPKNYTWNGTGSNGELVESGCEYQYVWYVKANDGADGYMPGIIETDVMLKEEDGILSFTLSSIQFGPNSAKFDNLDEEKIKHNNDLFDTVARLLKQYEDYTITIEGHANNVSGTEAEHIKELLPLSQARAETVKEELVQRGIKAERLIPVGRGSEKMIAKTKDEAWRNRRVEFYLEKKD